MNIRDNLLVNMGARAAYMECDETIELPAGISGEQELAEFVVEKVDQYIAGNIDESFDLYIERELEKRYAVK